MAYKARVFRVLIASPSDVEQERNIVARVIQEWNDVFTCYGIFNYPVGTTQIYSIKDKKSGI